MITVYGAPKSVIHADRNAFERLLQKWAAEAAEKMARKIDNEILAPMAAQHDDHVMGMGLFGMSGRRQKPAAPTASAALREVYSDAKETLDISENDEEWQSPDAEPVPPTMRAMLWGASGDGECEVELDQFGEPVEWDGAVPEPFLSKDPDTVFVVLQHYYDLLDAINHPSNKTGSTKIMLQCDDCTHGPCDVTSGIDETFHCHMAKEKREDGFYVGKFR